MGCRYDYAACAGQEESASRFSEALSTKIQTDTRENQLSGASAVHSFHNQSRIQGNAFMDCPVDRNRNTSLYRSHRGCHTLFNQRGFLCVRPDLRFDLVPVPTDFEKSLLYDLPDIQLGPSDDVYTDDFCKRILFLVSADSVIRGLADMGTVRSDIPGTVLGVFE